MQKDNAKQTSSRCKETLYNHTYGNVSLKTLYTKIIKIIYRDSWTHASAITMAYKICIYVYIYMYNTTYYIIMFRLSMIPLCNSQLMVVYKRFFFFLNFHLLTAVE